MLGLERDHKAITDLSPSLIIQIERHPDVVHPPAPHFWQLTLPRNTSLLSSSAPLSVSSTPSTPATLVSQPEAELVATVEIHVRKDMSDVEVFSMTKWANDKCAVALGRPRVGNVCVAIVRG